MQNVLDLQFHYHNIIEMSKNLMVMYKFETEQITQSQQPILQYPNAFIISTKVQITPSAIKKVFPWQKLPQNAPKKMRFGLKAGRQSYWLDIKDDQEVPLYTKSTIFIKFYE